MKKKFKQMGAFLVAMSVVAPQASMFREIDSIAVESNNIDQIITNEVEKEMDYITESNGNKAPRITLNDNNAVETIDATLSQDIITSSDDAIAVISNINDLLGINDVDQQLKFTDSHESLYNVVYRFKQQYEGIEFVNSSISLVVNQKNKKGKFLNSSFIPNFTIDTTPGITSDSAIQIANDKYSVNITNSPELVIYTNEEKEHRLAWDLTTDSYAPSEVYVDAQNGNILYERMPYDANEENDELVNYSVSDHSLPKTFPEEFTVNIARDDENNDLYKLHDTERNIYILNKKDDTTDNAKKEFVINDSYDNLNNYTDDLGVLYNVAMAYDFYNGIKDSEIIIDNDDYNKESKLVLESLLKSNLYVIPDLREADGTPVYNAYAITSNVDPYISFGTTKFGGKSGHLYDVVVHEYTHLVSDKKVGGWNYTGNGEPSSLSEAYSDIMGEYAEIKLETDDKKHQWNHADTRDLTLRNCYSNKEFFKGIECHLGGTVIGHVAYLMDEKQIPDEIALQIWFHSLDYLKGDSTFENCRIAVLKSAEDVFTHYNVSDEDIEKWTYVIKKAFNSVRVYDSSELMGDINRDNKVDINDINIIRDYINGDTSYIDTLEEDYYADLTADGVINEIDLKTLINMEGAIKITEQPTDKYINPGEEVKISATAESILGEELEYRWYYAHPGSDEFMYSGVRGVYIIRMSDGINGRKLYCEITDKSGHKARTDVITLYKSSDLNIIQQPIDSYVNIGETAKVYVVAEGDDLKYKWYYYAESYDKFLEATAFKSNKYELNMRNGFEDEKVYCEITDMYGNTVTTDVVTLGVRGIIITKQPTDQYAKPGEEIKVFVEAEGEDLEYKWYHAQPGSDEFTNSGVRGVYIVRMSDSHNGRRLYCEISDAYGNVVKSDVVTLHTSDIKITKQPTDQYAKPGEEIKVFVEAEGEDLEYKWYHAEPGSDEFTNSGVRGVYIVRMSDSHNGRRLYCEITDKSGAKIKSDVVTLYKVTVPGQNGSEKNYGDANNDGKILLSDSIHILQYLGNPDTYHISNPEAADVYNPGDGLTNADALAIQKYILKIITVLPEFS